MAALIYKISKQKPFRKGAWLILICVMWELGSQSFGISPLVLPTFFETVMALIEGITTGTILLQLLQSLLMVFVALVVCLIVALLMATIGYHLPLFDALFELLSALFHPLPGIALLPIVILWVGVGLPAVFVIVFHAIIWALYLQIKLGFNTIDKHLIEVAHNHGAKPMQLSFYVLIPGSVEAMKSGLQIGWSRGWRALISAEMLFGAMSSLGGMGWYLYERRAFMDTKGIYAGLLAIMLVGIVIENILFGAQKDK